MNVSYGDHYYLWSDKADECIVYYSTQIDEMPMNVADLLS